MSTAITQVLAKRLARRELCHIWVSEKLAVQAVQEEVLLSYIIIILKQAQCSQGEAQAYAILATLFQYVSLQAMEKHFGIGKQICF